MQIQGKITISKLLIIALFFLSGFSALTYEIVWQRLFVQLTGATALATTTTISLFLSGMALGALSYPKLKSKRVSGLLFFLIAELCVAISGLVSTLILNHNFFFELNQLIKIALPNLSFYESTKFASGFAYLLLLFPTMAMGTTLPALADFSSKYFSSPRELLTQLYLANTTGAVFATLCSAFILLPSLGISRTILVAACINLFVFLASLLVLKSSQVFKENVSPLENVSSIKEDESQLGKLPIVSVYVSGFAFMIMEVVWSRYLVVLNGSSTYCLSIVLALCLSGISMGTYLAKKLSQSRPIQKIMTGHLFLLSSATLFLCLYTYNATPFIYLWLLDQLSNHAGIGDFYARLIAIVSTSSVLIIPSATSLGAIFPFALATQENDIQKISAKTSFLLGSNLLGTILGAISIYILFERDFTHIIKSNIQLATLSLAITSLIFCALIYLTNAAYLKTKGSSQYYGTIAGLLICTALLCFRPTWNQSLMTAGYSFIPTTRLKDTGASKTLELIENSARLSDSNFYYREASNSIVSVKRNKGKNLTSLTNDGKTEASIPISRRLPSPSSDLSTHTLMGLFPSILCKNEDQDSLIIGYGSGTTCGTNLTANWVSNVTAVEIDEAVYSIDPYFQPANLSPLKLENINSGRFKPVVADARCYLTNSKKKYDTIISQPAEPWITGSSNLYTLEFFELASKALKRNGIFCQWLQLYAISESDLKTLLKTFNQAFEQTYIVHKKNAGEIILFGKKDNSRFDLKIMKERTKQPMIRTVLNQIDINDLSGLLSKVLLCPEDVNDFLKEGSIKLNTDDNLHIELSMSQKLTHEESSIDSLVQKLSTKRNEKSSIAKNLENLDKETVLKLGLSTSKDRFSSFRPYSDKDLESTFGQIDVKDKKTKNFLVLGSLECLTDLADTICTTKEKLVFSARLHQEIKKNAPADFYSPFLNEYRNLKTEDDIASENNFINSQLARFWLEENELKKALLYANRVTHEETNPFYLYNAGFVNLSCGEIDSARKLLLLADKIDPDNSKILSCLACCEALSQTSAKVVVQKLKKSLSLDPNQYIPRYLLAQLYYKQGKLSLCLNEMTNASKVSFTDPSPNVFVTALFLKIHHYENAKKNLAILKRIAPNSPFITTLGYAIARSDRSKKGIAEQVKPIELGSGLILSPEEIEKVNRALLECSFPKDLSNLLSASRATDS